jgi:hypothetical protein
MHIVATLVGLLGSIPSALAQTLNSASVSVGGSPDGIAKGGLSSVSGSRQGFAALLFPVPNNPSYIGVMVTFQSGWIEPAVVEDALA